MSFNKDEDDATGISPTSDAEREAWKLTNEDMEAIANERRAEGWDVTTATAVHTNPANKDQGETDRFGFVYILPGNHADDFAAAYERADGDFADFVVYRREINISAFLVTELLDPETKTAIVVAGHYDRRRAGGLVKNSIDEGEIYTHAQTLDGTHLGTVRHEEFDPFFPSDDEATDGA
jgi:hypothetical protein